MSGDKIDKPTRGLTSARRIWHEIWGGNLAKARELWKETRGKLGRKDAQYIDGMLTFYETGVEPKPDVPVRKRRRFAPMKPRLPATEEPALPTADEELRGLVFTNLKTGTDGGVAKALNAFLHIKDPSVRRKIVSDIASFRSLGYRGEPERLERRKELKNRFLRMHLDLVAKEQGGE